MDLGDKDVRLMIKGFDDARRRRHRNLCMLVCGVAMVPATFILFWLDTLPGWWSGLIIKIFVACVAVTGMWFYKLLERFAPPRRLPRLSPAELSRFTDAD